jgi:hypothetical protein
MKDKDDDTHKTTACDDVYIPTELKCPRKNEMSLLNLMIGRCDHAEFLYRLSLTKSTELREVNLHG